MVAEFEATAFSQALNSISNPVKTQFGWHIIRVEERHPAGVIPYGVARQDILNKLLPTRQEQELEAHVARIITLVTAHNPAAGGNG